MADSIDQIGSDQIGSDQIGPLVREPDLELELIVAGEHGDPHRVLGFHDGVVRAYRPDALAMRVIPVAGPTSPGNGGTVEMTRLHPAGIFEAAVAPGTDHYHLEADYGQPGFVTTFRFHDPYRAWPTLGELDLHLLG
jgi:1,4-alpha-glucan branching enzyme